MRAGPDRWHPPRVRVLIVDDNPGFLAAAGRLLRQEGLVVAGVASSGEEALRLAGELRPDATLLDIDLGPEDGITVAGRLARTAGRPAGSIIFISTHDEDEFAELVEASPAVGFIPKSGLNAAAILRLIEGVAGT